MQREITPHQVSAQSPVNMIALAIERAGGPAEVARLLGCSVQAVCFYRDGKRSFPAEHCAPLSQASGVKRWEMRPDDWFVVWPELVGAEGAPPAAATSTAAKAPLAQQPNWRTAMQPEIAVYQVKTEDGKTVLVAGIDVSAEAIFGVSNLLAEHKASALLPMAQPQCCRCCAAKSDHPRCCR